MKYVGITSRDPKVIKKEWEEIGREVEEFRIIQSGLTYYEALALEDKYKKMGYEAEPGGPREDGPVYYVYAYEYW